MTEFDWQFHSGAGGSVAGVAEWLSAAGIDDHVPRWGDPAPGTAEQALREER